MDVSVQDNQVGRPADGVVNEDDEHHSRLPYRLHQRLVRRLTREPTHFLLGRMDVDEDSHVADGDDDERYHDADSEVEHGVGVHVIAGVARVQRHVSVVRPVHVRRDVDQYAEQPRGCAADGRRRAREDRPVASVATDVNVAVDGDEADAEQRAGAADHADATQGGVQAWLVVIETHALDDACGENRDDY